MKTRKKNYHLFLRPFRSVPRGGLIRAGGPKPIYQLHVLGFGLLFLFILIGVSSAQYYVPQHGRLLDANPRVGSLGLNTQARYGSLVPRANLYVTGNITGGASFQGIMPYRSSYEFQDTLGSGLLGNFRRDSIGLGNLSSGLAKPRPYVDASRSVTRIQGSRVVHTNRIYQSQLTPTGTTSLPQSKGGNLAFRPLSKTYSLGYSYPVLEFSPAVPYGIGQADRQRWMPEAPTGSAPPLESGSLPSQRRLPSKFTPQASGASPGQFQEPPAIYPQDYQRDSATVSELQSTPDNLPPTNPAIPLRLPPAQQGQTAPESAELPTGTYTSTRSGLTFAPSAGSRPLIAPPLSTSPGDTKVDLAAVYHKQFSFYMNRGKELMQKKMYYQAATAFETAALYYPPDERSLLSVAFLAKSHALLGAGEFMSSAYFLNKTLELAPESARSEIDLNQIFPDKQKFQKQMDELDLWQKRTGQPMLMFLKGYVLYHTGRFDQADQVLTKSLHNLPRSRAIKCLLDAVAASRKTEKAEKSKATNDAVPIMN